MDIKTVTHLRNDKLHLSGVMLMGIIHKLVTKTNSSYLSEIEAFYHEISKKGASYTQSGMRSYLNKLHRQGYVHISREGRYCNYALTQKGIRTVSTLK